MSIAVHDHLPVLAMAYSDALNCWATATHNEINFIRWRPRDCRLPAAMHLSSHLNSRFPGHIFHSDPADRIIAKKVSVSSEEEQEVEVTSLNWMNKSNNAAHLVVSFLHHHVEYAILVFLLFVQVRLMFLYQNHRWGNQECTHTRGYSHSSVSYAFLVRVSLLTLGRLAVGCHYPQMITGRWSRTGLEG